MKTSRQQSAYNKACQTRKLDQELLEELYLYAEAPSTYYYTQQVDFNDRAPTPTREGWEGLGA